MRLADEIGYPLMIKAAAGGGGRGIRVVAKQRGARGRARSGRRRGQGGVRRRRPLSREVHRARPPHRGAGARRRRATSSIATSANVRCSAAGRKSGRKRLRPSSPPAVREALCASAVALARSVAYRGAGTLEYLYDDTTRQFYFIEMNTRIQVEHPVTEMITGIDLVREMMRIAGGAPLQYRQDDVRIRGPCDRGAHQRRGPGAGLPPLARHGHGAAAFPAASRTRFDTLLYAGCQVSPFYDSLARQADRLGRDARRRAFASAARASRIARRRDRHDEAAASGARRGAGRVRGRLSHALARRMARRKREPNAVMKEDSIR